MFGGLAAAEDSPQFFNVGGNGFHAPIMAAVPRARQAWLRPRAWASLLPD